MSVPAELPDTEILTCSACGEVIWRHRTDPITARMSLPSYPWPGKLGASAIEALWMASEETYLQTVTIPAEKACRAHFGEKHPIRFWVWERFGWDRVLRKWFR